MTRAGLNPKTEARRELSGTAAWISFATGIAMIAAGLIAYSIGWLP